MLLRAEDRRLTEARATTKRVARTFAIACRLLPRSLRDDVYLLYLVFRTLDDLVDTGDPDAEPRIAAVEAWCAGAPPDSPEAHVLADLAARHPLPPGRRGSRPSRPVSARSSRSPRRAGTTTRSPAPSC